MDSLGVTSTTIVVSLHAILVGIGAGLVDPQLTPFQFWPEIKGIRGWLETLVLTQVCNAPHHLGNKNKDEVRDAGRYKSKHQLRIGVGKVTKGTCSAKLTLYLRRSEIFVISQSGAIRLGMRLAIREA